MEIISLLALIIPLTAIFAYFIKFKSVLALFNFAPLAFVIATILFLNTDPTLEYTYNECFSVVTNSTVSGNFTSYSNDIQCQDVTDAYPIEFTSMQIINGLMFSFVFFVVVLVFRRITASTSGE